MATAEEKQDLHAQADIKQQQEEKLEGFSSRTQLEVKDQEVNSILASKPPSSPKSDKPFADTFDVSRAPDPIRCLSETKENRGQSIEIYAGGLPQYIDPAVGSGLKSMALAAIKRANERWLKAHPKGKIPSGLPIDIDIFSMQNMTSESDRKDFTDANIKYFIAACKKDPELIGYNIRVFQSMLQIPDNTMRKKDGTLYSADEIFALNKSITSSPPARQAQEQSPERVVYVHCNRGKSRTGAMMGMMAMIQTGMSLTEASTAVNKSRKACRTIDKQGFRGDQATTMGMVWMNLVRGALGPIAQKQQHYTNTGRRLLLAESQGNLRHLLTDNIVEVTRIRPLHRAKAIKKAEFAACDVIGWQQRLTNEFRSLNTTLKEQKQIDLSDLLLLAYIKDKERFKTKTGKWYSFGRKSEDPQVKRTIGEFYSSSHNGQTAFGSKPPGAYGKIKSYMEECKQNPTKFFEARSLTELGLTNCLSSRQALETTVALAIIKQNERWGLGKLLRGPTALSNYQVARILHQFKNHPDKAKIAEAFCSGAKNEQEVLAVFSKSDRNKIENFLKEESEFTAKFEQEEKNSEKKLGLDEETLQARKQEHDDSLTSEKKHVTTSSTTAALDLKLHINPAVATEDKHDRTLERAEQRNSQMPQAFSCSSDSKQKSQEWVAHSVSRHQQECAAQEIHSIETSVGG